MHITTSTAVTVSCITGASGKYTAVIAPDMLNLAGRTCADARDLFRGGQDNAFGGCPFGHN